MNNIQKLSLIFSAVTVFGILPSNSAFAEKHSRNTTSILKSIEGKKTTVKSFSEKERQQPTIESLDDIQYRGDKFQNKANTLINRAQNIDSLELKIEENLEKANGDFSQLDQKEDLKTILEKERLKIVKKAYTLFMSIDAPFDTEILYDLKNLIFNQIGKTDKNFTYLEKTKGLKVEEIEDNISAQIKNIHLLNARFNLRYLQEEAEDDFDPNEIKELIYQELTEADTAFADLDETGKKTDDEMIAIIDSAVKLAYLERAQRYLEELKEAINPKYNNTIPKNKMLVL